MLLAYYSVWTVSLLCFNAPFLPLSVVGVFVLRLHFT